MKKDVLRRPFFNGRWKMIVKNAKLFLQRHEIKVKATVLLEDTQRKRIRIIFSLRNELFCKIIL